MVKKHIIELLIEANKQISNTITKMENDDLPDNKIIDNINDVIRQLDSIVEHLER